MKEVLPVKLEIIINQDLEPRRNRRTRNESSLGIAF